MKTKTGKIPDSTGFCASRVTPIDGFNISARNQFNQTLVPIGNRNNAVFNKATYMAKKGSLFIDIMNHLLDIWKGILPESEIRTTVISAYKKAGFYQYNKVGTKKNTTTAEEFESKLMEKIISKK